MVRDAMETETLARLYLEQGHFERAISIFERLLEEDPARRSLAEGLERCRAAMRARRVEGAMQAEKRLKVLRRMLARLTGAEPEPEPVSEPAPARPVPVAAAPLPPPRRDPLQRRLELLRAMLAKLQGLGASRS